MPGLQTFDVFDTLLVRAVGDPTSVFLLLGQLDNVRELTGCHPEEFARLRVAAERRARSGRAEVTLPEIYTELAAGLNLTPTEADAVLQEELRLEQRLSRAV